jgi:hypothetical protein
MISKPYPYRHTYKVLLYKNSTLEWITYAMHCDHEVPMHHKTKKELYDRLAMGGIQSKEIKRIKAA